MLCQPSSLLKNVYREGEAPAEPQETSDFPHVTGFFNRLLGQRPRCSTHLFELPATGWAEGVPAEGHVVQALESFPDCFDAGHRVDRAVHEAAQLADHAHHLMQDASHG